jgi:hypothetical protein
MYLWFLKNSSPVRSCPSVKKTGAKQEISLSYNIHRMLKVMFFSRKSFFANGGRNNKK